MVETTKQKRTYKKTGTSSSCCGDSIAMGNNAPLKIKPFEELTYENKVAVFKTEIAATKGLVKSLKRQLFDAERTLNRQQKDYDKLKKSNKKTK